MECGMQDAHRGKERKRRPGTQCRATKKRHYIKGRGGLSARRASEPGVLGFGDFGVIHDIEAEEPIALDVWIDAELALDGAEAHEPLGR